MPNKNKTTKSIKVACEHLEEALDFFTQEQSKQETETNEPDKRPFDETQLGRLRETIKKVKEQLEELS